MRKKQSIARRGWAILGLLALFLLGMGQPIYARPAWSESAPYIHFVNYHYVGNGVEGGARDVIMEYSPLALALAGCDYNDYQRLDEETQSAWSEIVNQYSCSSDTVASEKMT